MIKHTATEITRRALKIYSEGTTTGYWMRRQIHIEFIKEPADIDEAVYYTVCFQETRQRKNRHYSDNIRAMEKSTDSDSDDDNISTARAVPGKNRHKVIRQDRNTNTSTGTNNVTETDKLDTEKVLQIVKVRVEDQFLHCTKAAPS